MKSTDFYLAKYRVHIIVLSAIVTSNLKYIYEFDYNNISFWVLLIFPLLGLLGSCAFATILYVGIALLEGYLEKDKQGEFEKKIHFTRYLLITSIVNLLLFYSNGITVLDVFTG